MSEPINILTATNEVIQQAVVTALGWKTWELNDALWIAPGATERGGCPPEYLHDTEAALSLLGGDYDIQVRNQSYVHVIIYESSNQFDGYGRHVRDLNRAACAAYLRSKGVAVTDL